jgi:hypothetical protein
MRREQLAALTADVDHLLAAGATAAAGSDSLRRRSKTLREMGQKVAALNPIADAIDRVTNAAPSKAAPALLDLVVLSRQIRASLSGQVYRATCSRCPNPVHGKRHCPSATCSRSWKR